VEELCYSDQAAVQRDHWWYVGRRRLLRDLLAGHAPTLTGRGRALDVGCGVGANTLLALEHADSLVALDDSATALRFARGAIADRRCRWVSGDAARLPFADQQFDLVLALDVLEHIDDDAAAAAELLRVLRPGGLACIFVPALRALWGLQDRISHHRRRYAAGELRQLVAGAGFGVERLTFFNCALLPPIALARWAMRLYTPPDLRTENELGGPVANAVLRTIFGLETRLLRHLDLPIGVSLACLARRPA
jgi:SAM-dependent methyltransferase